MKDFRIGYGYDIHRLEKGNKIILGGVSFDCDYQINAHSDGDIILHTISQAILSSLSKNDIGFYFPDNSKKTENINSKEILDFVISLLQKEKYEINNISLTIITEVPKINPIRDILKKSLCSLLKIEDTKIAIHANTKEKCGEVGKKEAIECVCVLSICK